jgi:hypothetical protein
LANLVYSHTITLKLREKLVYLIFIHVLLPIYNMSGASCIKKVLMSTFVFFNNFLWQIKLNKIKINEWNLVRKLKLKLCIQTSSLRSRSRFLFWFLHELLMSFTRLVHNINLAGKHTTVFYFSLSHDDEYPPFLGGIQFSLTNADN